MNFMRRFYRLRCVAKILLEVLKCGNINLDFLLQLVTRKQRSRTTMTRKNQKIS